MSIHLEGSIQEEEEISLASKARGEISFIQHNVGKRQEVQQTLLEIGFRRKTDIILVQEPSTWKDRQKGSYFSIPHPAFNLILPSNLAIRPRVAIYIRKTSSSILQYRNREDICKDTDIIALEIYSQFKRFLLLNIYNERQLDEDSRSQRNSRSTISRAILELEIDLPFILVGDYNLHHIRWNALARNSTREAKELVDWLDKHNCQLLNSDKQEGTFYRSNIREKSIIDLAFYSGNF
jgi:endonuclease/exonuclease/phosphatase (EEP) superfamily protein YafD